AVEGQPGAVGLARRLGAGGLGGAHGGQLDVGAGLQRRQMRARRPRALDAGADQSEPNFPYHGCLPGTPALIMRDRPDRRNRRMSAPHGPLQGVKVVACSTAQAGTVPYMLMADLGAEVIKIEAPDGGDPSRASNIMPGFPSIYFETNNRGVKSVTLNLKTP